MADPSRVALNWNALDASIIEAITEIQAARACIRHDAQTIAAINRNPNSEAQERFARCFDDAERMLDEIRAQMSVARSIFAGAPRMPSSMHRGPTITQVGRGAAYGPQAQKPSSHPLRSFKKRLTFIARSSARKFMKLVPASDQRANRMAVNAPKRTTRAWRNFMIVSVLQTLPFFLRRRLWRSIKPSFAKNSLKAKTQNQIPTYRHAFYPQAAFVLAAMVGLGVVASIAWAAWAPTAVSAANAGPSETTMERSAVPARGCSVSAWGKACYPRRSRL